MSSGHHNVSRGHKVYQPGRRYMEHVPTLSRSSGLDKDGDSLKNLDFQEEYRHYIQIKLDEYWRGYYPRNVRSPDVKRRDEIETNLLIIFRKLREGLLATDRRDKFALEVYETSLLLSLLFGSSAQATSVISHLLPKVYLSLFEIPLSGRTSALLSCLHFLVAAYPSQGRYMEHIAVLSSRFLPARSSQRQWLNNLTRALRQRNYAALNVLTDRDALLVLLPVAQPPKPSIQPESLAYDALCTLVDALRAKARDATWSILRSAYRELHCPEDISNLESNTISWLYRSLTLHSLAPSDKSATVSDDELSLVNAWLTQKAAIGEVRLKGGTSDRWIVCKVQA